MLVQRLSGLGSFSGIVANHGNLHKKLAELVRMFFLSDFFSLMPYNEKYKNITDCLGSGAARLAMSRLCCDLRILSLPSSFITG